MPINSISKMGTVSRFNWSHALLAVGFLAVSGAGTVVLFKNAIIPSLKSWIRKVVSEEEEGLLKKNNGKPRIVEEASAAAKAAAAAAADVARATQQMLTTKSEEKKLFEELISMLNVQVNEMKSMRNSIQKLEGGQSISARIAAEQWNDQRWITKSTVCSNQPWEASQSPVSSTSMLQTRGNQSSADDAVPWWQRKNVRITEIESGTENKLGSSNILGNDRPVQRSWVPPQPPPVAMPEAAAAIRQPKKPSYQKEQMTDDQLLARSADVTDELQRITKISESGGNVEANGETSGLYSAEIQKEENGSYVGA
ncbi:hypothetical protein DH2020_012955 [Rehmannia glutinosa]|uniref:Peroxisomal membrane protein PEX14 n=1 Tax=Rehmannia glutinosa TaxID=99300 RepID=A0ABR0X3E0_REHGL